MNFDAVLDGELLVVRSGDVAPFSHLQQRLNRKTVTREMLRTIRPGSRLYDILLRTAGGPAPTRNRVTAADGLKLVRAHDGPPADGLSRCLIRLGRNWRRCGRRARENGIEGLMLKRAD